MRKPSADEERLIDALIRRSTKELSEDWKSVLTVEAMNDGGMGSLLLFPEGRAVEKRVFGGVASKIEFKDEDGTAVLVSLNLDKDGKLLEVDIWKVDFTPLIRIPPLEGV